MDTATDDSTLGYATRVPELEKEVKELKARLDERDYFDSLTRKIKVSKETEELLDDCLRKAGTYECYDCEKGETYDQVIARLARKELVGTYFAELHDVDNLGIKIGYQATDIMRKTQILKG